MHSKLLKTARPQAKLVQGRNDWYRISNKVDSTTAVVGAEIYIYDEIGYFGVTASDFVRDLNALDTEQIDLHLNTPGGDAFDGVAIYQALKDHKAEITTIVDSLAASAGSFIAMAGDVIIMQKNAQMMIHDAMSLGIGNADDMETMRDRLNMISDNIASIYAERAGGSVEEWRSAMKTESWYNADEAVKAGLADQVGRDATETKNTFDLSIFNYRSREEAPDPEIAARAAVQFNPSSFSTMMREALA